MHEAYTRTGKITYTGGHTEDELTGIQLEIQDIPTYITLEKDGFKSTVETSESVKLSIHFEYEADALTALDAIIAAAVEAKRAIESRHQTMAHDLKTWANELKEIQKRCKVCNSTENLEAHHLESKHYSPSLMLSLGNGIVLCDRCHAEFHAFCGGKKASRRDFHKWLKEKAKGRTFTVKTIRTFGTTHKPSTMAEIARVKEIALQIEKETGKLPGRPTLMEVAGCKDHIAQKVLHELKQTRSTT